MSAGAGRRTRNPVTPSARPCLTAWQQAGIDLLSRSVVQLLHGMGLSRGQAIRRITRFAQQTVGVKMAAPRIVQNAVLDPIQRITSIVHSRSDQWHFAGW